MSSKIKNIILFTVIAAILILVYIFFLKPAPDQQNLVSSSPSATSKALTTASTTIDKNSSLTKDFLSVLLNVKNIKLDDTIFLNNAFLNLHDSSITLTPVVDEGRSNPFAPIGSDPVVALPATSVASDSAMTNSDNSTFAPVSNDKTTTPPVSPSSTNSATKKESKSVKTP